MPDFLHVIAFDMPYPPNYGGAIDIFFKIKALKENEVRVILHVFLYDGKKASPELETLCHKVYYYNRRRYKNPFSGDVPYIVTTRTDEQLLNNLILDNYPILFEGLHTTAFLSDPLLKGRVLMVRTHNIEHDYYRALELAESSYFKKYFFRIEAERLEKYESVLKMATHILPISPADTDYYSKRYPNVYYLPAFHSNAELQSLDGFGEFVLYHGNLGIGENNKAALYLIHEVFPFVKKPCVIAGNNPSRQLITAVKKYPQIKLISGISTEEILNLVQKAQVNVLVTFQSTGIKLKLLNSLFRGRYCVVNREMVENTGLETACISGADTSGLIGAINECVNKPFSIKDIEHRKAVLGSTFDNSKNAGLIVKFLHEQKLYT